MEPRDYIDTAAALQRYSVGQLNGFARRMDPGLEDRDFADAGAQLDRMPDGVFTRHGLSPADVAGCARSSRPGPGPDPFARRAAGQLTPVPDADPGPVEQPEFFRQVLDDGAHSAARKAAKRPWWLPAGDARNYVRTGWLYSIAAAVFIAAQLLGASATVAWMLGGFWLLVGAWHFLSAAAVRRGAGPAPQAGDHSPGS